MTRLQAIYLWNKYLGIATLLLSSIIAASCDREVDDFISQPTPSSTILTGYIKTPDGTPLSNIPVSVDFNITGLVHTVVIHKAKGSTDRSGFYRIFFEADNEIGQGLHSGYQFSVDFSTLSKDDYLIAERLDYPFTAFKDEWSGCTIKCDFTIPHKRLVNVTVVNDGTPVVSGKYAVRNMISYLKVDGSLTSGLNPWDMFTSYRVSEAVDIPQSGSVSVKLPCAVGIDNAIRVMYHGGETEGYPSGIPASEGKLIEISGDFRDEIKLKYHTPDSDNRWDEF